MWAHERDEAPVNGGRRGASELLKDNRAEQVGEVIDGRRREAHRADRRDHLVKGRVGGEEVSTALAHTFRCCHDRSHCNAAMEVVEVVRGRAEGCPLTVRLGAPIRGGISRNR